MVTLLASCAAVMDHIRTQTGTIDYGNPFSDATIKFLAIFCHQNVR